MSNFLKNLRESLETGKLNLAVKSEFNDIIEKADTIASDPNKLNEAKNNVKKLQDNKKPLTADEIAKLNEEAKIQQEKIDEFDRQSRINAILINIDLVIEKLTREINEFKFTSEILRRGGLNHVDLNKIIDDVLKNIKKYERPIDDVKITVLDDEDENDRDVE